MRSEQAGRQATNLTVPGWSPAESRVLVALVRRPLGLRSVRAVSRVAGVSTTSASRAVRRLEAAGLVAHETVGVPEGAVREVPVWTIRWDAPPWHAVAPLVRRAAARLAPVPSPGPGASGTTRVPARFAHVFWNEDLAKLDLAKDAVLVADRILRSEDPEAHAWMLATLPAEAIEAATRTRGLDARRARLGELFARHIRATRERQEGRQGGAA
jgi:MarR family